MHIFSSPVLRLSSALFCLHLGRTYIEPNWKKKHNAKKISSVFICKTSVQASITGMKRKKIRRTKPVCMPLYSRALASILPMTVIRFILVSFVIWFCGGKKKAKFVCIFHKPASFAGFFFFFLFRPCAFEFNDRAHKKKIVLYD